MNDARTSPLPRPRKWRAFWAGFVDGLAFPLLLVRAWGRR